MAFELGCPSQLGELVGQLGVTERGLEYRQTGPTSWGLVHLRQQCGVQPASCPHASRWVGGRGGIVRGPLVGAARRVGRLRLTVAAERLCVDCGVGAGQTLASLPRVKV